MSGSFSRSFAPVGRSPVLLPAQAPDTFPQVSGIDGSPAAILQERSDECTLSPCFDKLAFAASRQRSAYRGQRSGAPTVPFKRSLFQRTRRSRRPSDHTTGTCDGTRPVRAAPAGAKRFESSDVWVVRRMRHSTGGPRRGRTRWSSSTELGSGPSYSHVSGAIRAATFLQA